MARIVVLDAGPLGLASQAPGIAIADRCRRWIRDLDAAAVLVVVPEIADYEVRRELLRLGAAAGLRRLERLVSALFYDPITTPAMRLAAEFWSQVRRAGMPTADPQALDADCILAAQVALLGGPNDDIVIATTNVGHLGRFPRVQAELWELVVP
jgi:predicted nucleic acid-binding protein